MRPNINPHYLKEFQEQKIYVFYPKNAGQNDRLISENFIVYLKRLGLSVYERGIDYELLNITLGTISAIMTRCDTEEADQYINDINPFIVYVNIIHTLGQYANGVTAMFTFIDEYNQFIWNVQLEPSSHAESYIRQCQVEICNSYVYNPLYAYQPAYISSNYTKSILRSYIDKGEYDSIEGIYEGDEYTLGVKQGPNGKYYLIYHSSKQSSRGWQDGYIKAELRETSTSGVYRASWYGQLFQKMDSKIIFKQGNFSVYNENNEKRCI